VDEGVEGGEDGGRGVEVGGGWEERLSNHDHRSNI